MHVLSFIIKKIDERRVHLYLWARERAGGPHARFWLGALSFSEASFFLVPPDVMLIAMLMLAPSTLARERPLWINLALLTTFFSVLGGLFGYLIGFALFETIGEPIINTYNLHEEVEQVGSLYRNNAFWTVFVSALTPIPYKVFTISAGLFNINLVVFVMASLLGRGLRFFAVSFLSARFGPAVTRFFMRYFNIISFSIVILVVLLFILL